MALAISDVSGLKTTASLLVDDGIKLPFEPSVGVPDDRLNGIHARLATASALFAGAAGTPAATPKSLKGFTFRFDLTLNGTSQLSFTPVGRETTVDLSANWPAPASAGRSCRPTASSTRPTSRRTGRCRTWRAACRRPGASPIRAWRA